MAKNNQKPKTNSQLPTTKPALLAIAGPTASGKSALALKIAKRFGGEIISADSLTIYKNMDIGTAKPPADEQRQIKHWGIDICGPGERFTAAQFKRYAEDKIEDIRRRGKLPIVVGGTGLYIDSLLFDYQFSPPGSPRDPQNPRHLKKTGKPADSKFRPDTLMVGLMPSGEVLKQKISKRADQMFKAGLVEETQKLMGQYGQDSLLAKAKVAYGPVIEHLNGIISLDEARERLKTKHWQYARRQKTWLKRNPNIHWFGSADEAHNFLEKRLST